jgi:hypothetical protein
MAEVTLGDYAGYIYLEMIRAREMADEYSRQVAERYRADPVLEHFSVPRFRIPKLDLTVPILVSGVRLRETVRFALTEEEFLKQVSSELDEVTRQIFIRLGQRDPERSFVANESLRLAQRLYAELAGDPQRLGLRSIVTLRWPEILLTGLQERRLVEEFRKADRDGELSAGSLQRFLTTVEGHLVVDRTQLESLLVNPETNVVKNGSDESSVFVVKAEITEEGFFIRDIRDGQTGEVRPVVEFE